MAVAEIEGRKHENSSLLNEKSLLTKYICFVKIIGLHVYENQYEWSDQNDSGCIYYLYTSKKVRILHVY